MKIAIVDDSAEDRALLASYLKKGSCELHCQTDVLLHALGDNFLEDEDLSTLDAVFLDIFMDGKNGMEVAKALRERGYLGMIVFCTTTARFALEGYSVHALSLIHI